MEFWDLYNYKHEKIGKTIVRGDLLESGQYFLIAEVWIQNSDGEFLITKRAPNKTYPGLWTTPGGASLSGEDSLEAALREVKEEIGITLNPKNGVHLLSMRRERDHFSSFKDVWLFRKDFDISEVINQPEEVSESRWASRDEIVEMLESGDFVPVLGYFKEII